MMKCTHSHLPQLLKVGVAADVVVEVVPVVIVGGDGEVGGDCLEGSALWGTAELIGVEPGLALKRRPVCIGRVSGKMTGEV